MLETHMYATYKPRERKIMEMKSNTDQNLVCVDNFKVTTHTTAVNLCYIEFTLLNWPPIGHWSTLKSLERLS